MATVYEKIIGLCEQKGVSPGKMCNDLGYSRNTMTALKNGRSTTLKLDKAQRIANYFGVSVDYLLGKEKEPAAVEGDELEDAIKFALFGGEASDAQFEEVKRFAQFIKERDGGNVK